MLTSEELARHDGHHHPTIYLAVLGTVYDVTSGAKHYSRKGPYRALAARDASRILATGAPFSTLSNTSNRSQHLGDFVCNKDCDQVDDLESGDFEALERWRQLYTKVCAIVGSITNIPTVLPPRSTRPLV